jgi:hypothetical protein
LHHPAFSRVKAGYQLLFEGHTAVQPADSEYEHVTLLL